MANRPAKGEQNLFTGILYNAFDRSPMHLRSVTPSSKGKKRRRYSYLSSLEYKHGKPLGADGRFSRSIDCHAVERAVRSMIDELRPADISGRGEVGPGDEDIRRETEQLVALGQKEKMYKDKVRDPMTPVGALPTYFERIDQTATEKMASVQRREVLKAEALSGRPETLGETQSFFHLLDNAEGEEAAQIRRRLSARLRQLIEDVWVLVECVGYNKRAVHIQVNLRSGGSRWDRRYSPDVPEERDNPPCLDLFGVDLREVDPRVLSGLLETGEH